MLMISFLWHLTVLSFRGCFLLETYMVNQAAADIFVKIQNPDSFQYVKLIIG